MFTLIYFDMGIWFYQYELKNQKNSKFHIQYIWKIVRAWHHQLAHLNIHKDWSRYVFRKNVKFQNVTTSLDILECANDRFNFVFGRSLLKHCHSILCFLTRFRQLQWNFVGHNRWARDSKINFVYWHSFSSLKFHSKSSPRYKGTYNTWRIWMTK